MPILATRGAASAGGFGFGMPHASGNVYATWNPADAASGIVLSGGNLSAVASSGSGAQLCRATKSKSAGKWYWEVTLNTLVANQITLGIATASASLTTYLGNDTNGLGYRPGTTSLLFNAGSYTYSSGSGSSGTVIGVAFDAGTGYVTYYINGVSQGASPVAVGAGSWFPTVQLTGSTSNALTANFGATAFAYTVPTGYNPGVY